MLKNYFKIAWRNLGRNKVHSFINIAGLSFGMAVAILIGLWIYDELSYDRNFDNYDHVAQVIQNVTNNGEVQTWKTVPYPLADELRANYGRDFKHIAMAISMGDHLVAYNDKILTKNGGYFEPEASEIFSLKLLNGKQDALKDPTSVLISASAAKAYFGEEDPINKMLKIDSKLTAKVAGVYPDFPRNSTFNGLDFIAPMGLIYNNDDGLKTMEDPWRPNFASLFVQLNNNADFSQASAHIRDAKMKKVNAQLQKKKPALFLQPMSKWHLRSEFKNGVNVGGAIQYVWMFGIIGLFVLLLACINFMNLSTAQSEKRAKEVGIRKTVGSLRTQLITQFFCESLSVTVLAFVLSVILVFFTLPLFNKVADKSMSILWGNLYFWVICVVFTIITALVAGSYPAFYLSSFRPVKVLKGTFKAGRFAAIPRKVLVVLQFTVSVTLVICVITVYRQIQFAKDRPVGYSREGLVAIPLMTQEIHNHFDAVKDELIQTGAVASVAESESPTTGIWNTTSGFSWPGKDPNASVDFAVVSASYDYGKTIDWQLKEGRGFSREFSTDSSAVILNEAAVHFMGFKNAIGQSLTWWGKPLTVVGVIKNMVIVSPYDEAKPVIYTLSTDAGNLAMIKINPASSTKDALAKIEPVFRKFNPQLPFEYKFADEEYARKFSNEERVGSLASFFAILAIVISCLGLFGLTSFVAEQRKKEIGVRKVLGASVFSLWNLLSKDFVTLVIVSILLSVPLAYYFMFSWLQNYSYRTEMSAWIFVIAGGSAVIITLLTVSYQSLKAALANPVKSLRTE